MIISSINNSPHFEARIKINKQKIGNALLKTAGEASSTGGISTISTGVASGADMTVHNFESAVPSMQRASSLFDQFAEFGHKAFKILAERGYQHNGYDASFFSSSMSTGGTLGYMQGMNNIVKAIENKRKIPT